MTSTTKVAKINATATSTRVSKLECGRVEARLFGDQVSPSQGVPYLIAKAIKHGDRGSLAAVVEFTTGKISRMAKPPAYVVNGDVLATELDANWDDVMHHTKFIRSGDAVSLDRVISMTTKFMARIGKGELPMHLIEHADEHMRVTAEKAPKKAAAPKTIEEAQKIIDEMLAMQAALMAETVEPIVTSESISTAALATMTLNAEQAVPVTVGV